MKHFALFFTIAVSAFLLSCGDRKADTAGRQIAAPENQLIIPVGQQEQYGLGISEVLGERVERTISIPARIIIDPDQQALVNSLIEGRVRSVSARLGDRVAAGQVLATVESVELGGIVSDLIRYNSEQRTSKASLDRLTKLYAEGVGSEKGLQQSETEYMTAKAGFQSARQRLLAAGMNETDVSSLLADPDTREPVLRLRAPISGTITRRDASIGKKVGMSDELFEIVNTSSMIVEGNAFEEHFAELHEGLPAKFFTQVYPDSAFRGTLSYVGSTLDAETNSLPVRMRIAPAKARLRPNLNGRLDIRSGAERHLVSVPSGAIVFDGSERFVFVKLGDDRFEYRRVESGQDFGDRMEILKGLKAGDTVVSEGVFNLKSRLKLSQMSEEE